MLLDILIREFGQSAVSSALPSIDAAETLYADINDIIKTEDESANGAVRLLAKRIGGPANLASYVKTLQAGAKRSRTV